MMPGARTFTPGAALPEELTAVPRWICWQYQSKSSGSKPTKVPVQPHAQANARGLTDWQSSPSRWMTYEDAVAAYRANADLAGIGFVLTPDLNLVGLDLDGAIDANTAEVADWALQHVKEFDTYTEVSPSGEGLRMFVFGQLPEGVPHNVKPREIYTSGRWLTITGRVWNESPVMNGRDLALARYIDAMQAARRERVPPGSNAQGAKSNAELVTALLRGDELHDSTRDYVWRLVDDGMPAGKVVETLRGLMLSMPDRGEPGRWQERYDDIPRLVADAQKKQRRQAEPPPKGDHWGFVFADEMVQNLGPTRWLVRKLIPEDCTGVLYGPSGCLKSFLMLDMALSVATGTPWQGKPTKCRTVFYLAGEGEQGFAKRVLAWCQEHEIAAPGTFAFRQIPRLQDDCDQSMLINTIREIQDARGPAGLIVIDTLFTALNGGDENSGRDIGQIIAAMKRLRVAFGAAVFAVHHTGKIGDATRGHSSLPSGMDVLLFAKPGPAPLTVEISNPKQKDGAEHPSMLLEARIHELPMVGEDDEPETSLVLRNPNASLLASFQSKAKQTEAGQAKARGRASGSGPNQSAILGLLADLSRSGKLITPADLRLAATEKGLEKSAAWYAVKALIEAGAIVQVGQFVRLAEASETARES